MPNSRNGRGLFSSRSHSFFHKSGNGTQPIEKRPAKEKRPVTSHGTPALQSEPWQSEINERPATGRKDSSTSNSSKSPNSTWSRKSRPSSSSTSNSAANEKYDPFPLSLRTVPSHPSHSRKGSSSTSEPQSADFLGHRTDYSNIPLPSFPRLDSTSSTTPYSNMLQSQFSRNEARPGTSGYQSNGPALTPTMSQGQGPISPTLETITYQHIQEMASKRISTLDYLRKA